jgi:hypothetical protein
MLEADWAPSSRFPDAVRAHVADMSLALALDAISAARNRGVPLKEIELQRLYNTAMLGLKAPGSGHLGIRIFNEMNEVGIARAE